MKIFKYYTININLLQSLRKETNWYSKIHLLNDPFECFFINNTNTKHYEDLVSKSCVCCFSKNMNEILMWSHYADNHRGVCIEYEITDEETIKGRLFEINYNNELSVFDNIETDATGHLSLNITTNGKFLATKFKNWGYEEELRSYIICEEEYLNGQERPILGNITAIHFGKNTKDDDIALVKHNTSHLQNLKYFKVDLKVETMKIEITSQI